VIGETGLWRNAQSAPTGDALSNKDTTRRCTFTNVANEADRGRKSGSWDAEALTGASRAWEGERAGEVQGAQGLNIGGVHAAACSSGQVRADAHAAYE